MSNERPTKIEAAAFEPLEKVQVTRTRRLSPQRLALGVVLVAFAAALWFLLTARSLQINVIADGADDADIRISGLALPFGERYLLRPGSYRLRVAAAGYRPYDEALEVSREATQRSEVILQPLPGRLTIAVEPAGARVLLDGEALGQAPLDDAEVEAGEYTLRIEAPRYQALEQPLSITGRRVQQRLDIVLDPAWADISFEAQPDVVEVYVDGELLGEGSGAYEVLEGERRLRLEAAGFAALERELSVVAGEAQDLGALVLTPATGVLSLSSEPSGANVSVDGEFAGQTPLDIELEPGVDHRISLSRAGYQRASRSLRMEAGARDERSIRLEPLLGDVLVKVSPADAEVLVNGRVVGRGTQTLALPAVQQRLEFRLDGFESARRSVTPRPGLEQLVEVTLLTPEAARQARLTPTITTAIGQTLVLMNPIDSPKNEFSMGASRRDPGRRANEVLHPVRLERAFYFADREVTNAQFRLFESSHNSGQVEGNSLNREPQPAAQVSWQQAASFCNWLSRREGLEPFYLEDRGIIVGFDPSALGYRLPSEAEWAWVARVRGEELLRFTWGEEFPPGSVVENLADNSSAYVTGRILNGYNDGYVVSAPVGSFTANHHGIYDLGGNVSEWMNDVYTIPASSGVVATDPLGAQRGDNYVVRGASWALGRLPELRLSYRDYGQAGRDDVGFRIARYAE
ncbi:MAG: PEGA domain-containing protein [Halieaceae bacterium]|nr:PEGA domain-containing protein [Halieaceae bacterium]